MACWNSRNLHCKCRTGILLHLRVGVSTGVANPIIDWALPGDKRHCAYVRIIQRIQGSLTFVATYVVPITVTSEQPEHFNTVTAPMCNAVIPFQWWGAQGLSNLLQFTWEVNSRAGNWTKRNGKQAEESQVPWGRNPRCRQFRRVLRLSLSPNKTQYLGNGGEYWMLTNLFAVLRSEQGLTELWTVIMMAWTHMYMELKKYLA